MISLSFMVLQQVLRHGWYQRAGQQIGSQHGENHRFRQRYKQISSDAGQKEHRHEDDADGQRGDERWNGDLLCAIENCALDFFSCAMLRLMFSISTVASSTRMP